MNSKYILPSIGIGLLVIIFFFINAILKWVLVGVAGYIMFKALTKKEKSSVDYMTAALGGLSILVLFAYPGLVHWLLIGAIAYLVFKMMKK